MVLPKELLKCEMCNCSRALLSCSISRRVDCVTRLRIARLGICTSLGDLPLILESFGDLIFPFSPHQLSFPFPVYRSRIDCLLLRLRRNRDHQFDNGAFLEIQPYELAGHSLSAARGRSFSFGRRPRANEEKSPGNQLRLGLPWSTSGAPRLVSKTKERRVHCTPQSSFSVCLVRECQGAAARI